MHLGFDLQFSLQGCVVQKCTIVQKYACARIISASSTIEENWKELHVHQKRIN